MLLGDVIEPLFVKCRRLFSGTLYAMNFVRTMLAKKVSMDLTELKSRILEILDDFLIERILVA